LLIGHMTNGCANESPTTPSSHPPSLPVLVVTCVDQPTLRCSAFVSGGDVTTQARWSAADSFRLAMDVPVTASTALDFPSPGVVRPLHRQNVYIRADYTVSASYSPHAIAPHAYTVDPLQPPERLAYLQGETFINTIGGAILGGVNIDIIEGEGVGTHVVTLDANASYLIEFMHLNAPFTARASKPGYASSLKTHPGIVDDSSGYPSNNYLHFALTPQ
jgi:hypothetical protein